MAKLIFRYGAMDASKTANALMVRFNYYERGMHAVVLKPGMENRDGANIIKSRIGLSAECESVESFLEERTPEFNDAASIDCIIIDEAQFLTEEQVDRFAWIVDNLDIPVICYGLRTDFMGKAFPGSRRLLELADNLEEVPTICWCGRKARFLARVSNGKMVTEGEQVALGGNDMYVSLCRKHFMNGEIGPAFLK